MIVGFCDETEEDFEGSLEMAQYARFDMIYIGIYSDRKGTYAHRKYEDNIPADIKKERHAKLNTLLKDISAENNLLEHGQVKKVIINKIGKVVSGHTDNMKNIIITNPQTHLQTGDFVSVRITGSKPFLLEGEIV